MSDTRFIILGIVLIFAGIIVLSVFGGQFNEITYKMNSVNVMNIMMMHRQQRLIVILHFKVN